MLECYLKNPLKNLPLESSLEEHELWNRNLSYRIIKNSSLLRLKNFFSHFLLDFKESLLLDLVEFLRIFSLDLLINFYIDSANFCNENFFFHAEFFLDKFLRIFSLRVSFVNFSLNLKILHFLLHFRTGKKNY